MKLRLEDIERACGKSIVYRGALARDKVSCVENDSRKIVEDGVFIASVGEKVDGHKFIGDVFKKGAKLVITQKSPETVEKETGIKADEWGSYMIVEEPFEALKSIGEEYRKMLDIPVIGITGSVGKTSTKEYIAGVLSQKYNVLKTDGNYNNEIGVPLTLLRIREEHTAAVIEMGISDFGEMTRLSKMARPNICVITNIGQCHLENLKDRDGILKAKTEIFNFMASDGEVCLNGDDDKLITIGEVNKKKVHYFGIKDDASDDGFKEVCAGDIVSRGLWGSDANIYINDSEGERKFEVNVTLPGRHMVVNAAAAACVAKVLGLSDKQIWDGIKSVKPVNGRNHIIDAGRYTLIDDCYNANPVSMKAAIDLLMMADTKKAAILGDMFELGENSDEMHAGVGRYAAWSGVDVLIFVGENAKHMYDAACKELKAQGTGLSNAVRRAEYFADRDEFVESLDKNAFELIPEKSAVLVKASHGMRFKDVIEKLSACK